MPYYNSGHGPPPYGKDDGQGPSTSSGGRSSTSGSEPTYIMEHLATFTVTKETGIVYPADGMRRLLQLEKSNGIWSQKMQLRLERNWVLIMDNETGAVMERFPVSLIQEPTAFTSRDPMEMYNNILVFTVADDSGSGQRAEMHIFQCQSVSAQDLVEDLKMLQMGKLVPGGSLRGPRGQIPPPPALPPPEPPLNGVNVHVHISAFNAAINDVPNDGIREENMDEASSTSSEKYERDVTILNHCFDDIEKFIARLQHAAAASRELERRRRNSKSKKRNLGDGMLTMRAKPPPEMEFVDIFQKFKLCFNLLAKLKAHIHDPNAPELVHFLFTPLALIVDASHDTNYDPNLPNKVLSPLLTREAVNLLIHCVTSKETELWHSLGDTWLVPRDQWKGHVPLYHPIFMDGWSPEFLVADDHRDQDHRDPDHRDPDHRDQDHRDQDHRDQDHRDQDHRDQDHRDQHHRDQDHRDHDHREHDHRDHRDHDHRAHDHRDQEHRDHDHLASLLNADKQKRDDIPEQQNGSYCCHHDFEESHYGSDFLEYEAREERGNDYFERSYGPGSELYPRGERREREVDQTRAHSDISVDSIERGPRGASGVDRAQEAWLEELLAKHAKIVQVTYPRTANNDKELTVVRGEYLEILNDSRKWWKARNSRAQVAHVPHTIVTPHNPTHAGDNDVIFNNPLYMGRYQRQGHGYNYEDSEIEGASTSPGPETAHRPHAIPPPAPADWVRKERLGKKDFSIFNEVVTFPVFESSKSKRNVPRSSGEASGTSDNSKSKRNVPGTPGKKSTASKSSEPDHNVPGTSGKKSVLSESSDSNRNDPEASEKKSALSKNSQVNRNDPGTSGKKSTLSENSQSSSNDPGTSGKKSALSENSQSSSNDPGTSGKKSAIPKRSQSKSNNSGISGKVSAALGTLKNLKKSEKPVSRSSSVPPPPPPLPPLTPAVASCSTSLSFSRTGTIKKTKPLLTARKGSHQEKMREELESVLTVFREKKRSIGRVKTPDVYIDQDSTPKEVQKWLEIKGFSENIRRQFKDMDGTNLFNLTERQLEVYCGSTEGRRLNGEISISRNVAGYFTVENRELKQRLERVRQKIQNESIQETQHD